MTTRCKATFDTISFLLVTDNEPVSKTILFRKIAEITGRSYGAQHEMPYTPLPL